MLEKNSAISRKPQRAKCKAKTAIKKKIEVLSVNQPTQEEAQAKIKELSEYLSVAWVSPDNLE